MALLMGLWPGRSSRAISEGGPGSGNYGHAGRPGEVGGSSAAGGGDDDWTPVMKYSDAKIWAKDSAVSSVLFHRTTRDAAERIRADGVSAEMLSKSHPGNIADGFYVSTKPEEKYGPEELKIMVRITKPLKLDIAHNTILNSPAVDSDFSKWWEQHDSEYAEFRYAVTGYAKTHGYDGVQADYDPETSVAYHGDTPWSWYIVFDKKNIVVVDEKITEGGPGSGNRGHAGRPGEVGGSGEGGVVTTAYHSTSKEFVKNIMKKGILPKSRGLGDRAGSVFVTTKFDDAKEYAQALSFRYKSIVVFKVEIPSETVLKPDKQDAGIGWKKSYYTNENIRPEWIKGFYEMDDSKKRFVYHGLPQATESRTSIYFVPVVVDSESVEEGGPGSGNFGHSGRPGERGGSSTRDSGGAVGSTGKTRTELEAKYGKRIKGYSIKELERIETGVPEAVKNRSKSFSSVEDAITYALAGPQKVEKPSKVETTDDAQHERQGRCFELASRFVIDNREWSLVHATLYPRIGPFENDIYFHAFAEKDEVVYDPVFDRFYDKKAYYEYYSITDERRYDWEDSSKRMLKTRNYGPWD